MKFSQIAIYVPDQKLYKQNFFDIFNEQMYSDHLKMDGEFLRLQRIGVDLDLSFNHSIMNNMEIEYITSKSKYHWHHEKIFLNPNLPFLSHLGIYCNKTEFEKYFSMLMTMKIELLQDSISYGHSNKRLEDGDGPSSRHYRDMIFNTELLIGFNIKLSLKIES